MELDDDIDDPEVEVELDSIGSLFMHLVNNDLPQEDAEASQADDVEVITLSSIHEHFSELVSPNLRGYHQGQMTWIINPGRVILSAPQNRLLRPA